MTDEESRRQLRLRNEERLQDELADLTAERIARQQREEEQAERALSALRQSAQNKALTGLSLFAQKSSGVAKALFQVQKGIAIAESIINTKTGVTKALSVANFPLAAAIAAAGAIEVAGIISTNPGSGGGGINTGISGGAISTSVGGTTSDPFSSDVPTPAFEGERQSFGGNVTQIIFRD